MLAIEECEHDSSDDDAVRNPETPQPKLDTEENEQKELAKIMMTNKSKRLYSKMQYRLNEKKQSAATLEAKSQLIKKSKKRKA